MASDLQPPLVHGQPTALHQLSHAELAHTPLLPSLTSLINAAYASTHGPPYLPANMVRLSTDGQLLEELAPASTIYVLSQEDKVLGAIMVEEYDVDASKLPAEDADPTAAAFRPRLEGDGAGEYRRIVRFFVVDPTLHRQGVGSWLAKVLEEDSKRRARLLDGVSAVRLGLATAEEINGAYYARRGWRTTRRTPMPAGFFGSPEGFTALWMDKEFTLA